MFWADLKFAIRSQLRNRSVTVAAVSALALGIGANTAIFSVVNAVLLRPLNYPQPERIAQVARSYGTLRTTAVTPTKFDFWQKQNRSFEALAAYNFLSVGLNYSGAGEPERVTALPVSSDFFRVLGVRPLSGRTFSRSEDTPGAGHFAVLSYRLWQRLFQSSKNAADSIVLNNTHYAVVGVMPEGFEGPEAADLWTPLQLKIDPADRANDYAAFGRLKAGVSLKEAAVDMHRVGQLFRHQYGTGIMMEKNEDVAVIDYHSSIVGDVRPALLVLMISVGFVLLIACANVANLLLARSALRKHEMAVRSALGASAWQLVRLLLTESFLLSIAGAVLGILLAALALPLLIRMAPVDLPMLGRTSLNLGVLWYSGGIALLCALLSGALPALHNFRGSLENSLREAGVRTTGGASAMRARQLLVVAEVAISLVLLVGAGLLIQTFQNLSAVRPGFDARRVLTLQMSLTAERFQTTGASTRLSEQIVSRLEAIPDVESVGTISTLPTTRGFDDPFEILGRPPSKDLLDEDFRAVSPHYFSVMRIPVVSGRAFTERDTRESRRVIIINQAFVRKYFPHQDPLGQQIMVGREMGPIFADLPREVIGVVGDTREDGLNTPPPPIFFEPAAQLPDALMALSNQMIPVSWVIRTSGDPLALAETIRRETLVASGGVPMAEPRLLAQVINGSIEGQRFSMTLLSIFAALALCLGAIGLYSVISYSVAQRTRELGIRAALGASRSALSGLVIRESMWLAGAGLAVGLATALGLTHFLKSMLYGVAAFDPLVLVVVTALLAAVALGACWLPANRAGRIDPVIALREE